MKSDSIMILKQDCCYFYKEKHIQARTYNEYIYKNNNSESL